MTERHDPAVDGMSAAGQATDIGTGVPQSGMPAGGPDDLAVRAADTAEERSHEPADPFGAGIDARANGAGIDDCPYPETSDEAGRWIDGFHYRDAASAEG